MQEVATNMDKKYQQPVLVTFGNSIFEPVEFFLVVDRVPFPAGSCIIEAFDRLYKCFYAFNLEYPVTLEGFYQFFDTYVYKLIDPANARPQLRNLMSSINLVKNTVVLAPAPQEGMEDED